MPAGRLLHACTRDPSPTGDRGHPRIVGPVQLALQGRSAFVTGGTKGIGLASARALAAEGAAVTICARTEADVSRAVDELQRLSSDTRVHGVTCDVTDADAVEGAIAAAVDVHAGLDIVVNNAGGATPGSFEQLTNTAWQRDVEIKLFSQVNVVRAALPALRRSSAPRIINIGAVYATSPDASFFASSVTRAACHNLTKVLAQELGPSGILVNSVNVGLIDTPQWDSLWQAKAPETPREEFVKSLARDSIPLGRFGKAGEVAGVVAFLAGDRASYITGAAIDVAGGMGA
ncbi:SDR family oxidoreductase [Kribbella sp. NPDC050124]|uniref:SDR family oxidoreductase n=1 Tax=Kribbella sp. NPDC050124 TaxID=3364114 RepID=UPI0037AD76BC